MKKKLNIAVSLMVSFLMITSLFLPELANAKQAADSNADVYLVGEEEEYTLDELLEESIYGSEEEALYYENLEDEEYYDHLEEVEGEYLDETGDYPVDYFDDSLLEEQEIEIIENYNEDDFEIVIDDSTSIEDTYTEVMEPEFSVMALPFIIPVLVSVVVRQGAKRLVQQTLSNGTKRMITVKNGHLAGKSHPVTKVKFNSKGFPIFSSKHNYTLPNKYLKSSNTTQFKQANANLKTAHSKNAKKYNFTKAQQNDIKNGKTPRGYVWHHHQDRGKLQLVNKSTHDKTGHTGGKAIWGTK